ncbi:MAG: long-chain-fatty-acid--CoA ligase [Alphaproteobacteria bacterium]|nr:long-chain-fatty-acid--CoA ligase [Alphaproteobacteria bacterium]
MLETLGEVLPAAADQFGNKTALVAGDRRFSFTELNELSNRLANGLRGIGVEAGDRVTLYAPNSWEWVVSYHAIHKLGAVANPINVMLTPEEVGFVVKDCGAKALIASREKGVPVLTLRGDDGQGGTLREVVLFGRGAPPTGARAFDELLAAGSADMQVARVPPDSLSTICYTSGTTGHPKGAMHSHRNVIVNTAMTAVMHVRTREDTVVTALPCPHVYGNVVMNASLLYGMTLVLLPSFDPAEVMAAIEEHRATLFEGVPTMFMYMLAHPDFDRFDLSSLTRCTVGGQTMPAAKMEEFERRAGCPLVELWGMTEIAGLGTTTPLYGKNRHGSIGVQLPHVECRIADLQAPSKTVPVGEVGELMVRGPIVMLGYYANEAATRATIEPDGWLHSGDLARQDEDGYVWIVDRRKDMILTAGYNVYPAELERVIAMHPAVALVAVGPQPDAMKGETAKAYVVLKPGETTDEESIVTHCRAHLAAYKVPRQVQFVDDVPKTSTGKIMRRELKTLDA